MSDPTWVRVLGVQFREDGPWASLRPGSVFLTAAQVEQVRERRSETFAKLHDRELMRYWPMLGAEVNAYDWLLALLGEKGGTDGA